MNSISKDVQDPLRLQGLRILVVDDEEDALLMLKIMLEVQGAVVTTASSVQAALRALSFCQPDVLISDIAMPDEDGFVLIQKVQSLSEDQGSAIPAIAFSALDSVLCATACIRAGFQSYVAKPIEPETLITTILDTIPVELKRRQQQHFNLNLRMQSQSHPAS